MRLVPLVSCLAIACAPPDVEDACKNFLDAANGCNRDYAKEYDVEAVLLDDKLCETDTSGASKDELKEAVDRYECKYDAYAEANCRNKDEYENAIADADSCDD